jgi:hypothetical protein
MASTTYRFDVMHSARGGGVQSDWIIPPPDLNRNRPLFSLAFPSPFLDGRGTYPDLDMRVSSRAFKISPSFPSKLYMPIIPRTSYISGILKHWCFAVIAGDRNDSTINEFLDSGTVRPS